MVQASDNMVIDTFHTGDTPWGVAVALNEQFAYVSNFGEQTVYYIEVSEEQKGGNRRDDRGNP